MGFVKLGNKDSSPIPSIGDICVSTNLGVKLTLKNVRLVPDLRLNLLSVRKFDKEGYISCFGEGIGSLPKVHLFKQKERSVPLSTKSNCT